MVEWANGRVYTRQFILSNAPVVAVYVVQWDKNRKKKERKEERVSVSVSVRGTSTT